jgi:transposase
MDRRCRHVELDDAQTEELRQLRDTAPKPYLRERCAAILKIAEGSVAAQIARSGLLRLRRQETVREWLNRYQQEGIKGLYIQTGRGRKPAFSPSIQRQGTGS